MSFVWEHGGDIATKEGDQWVGQLDSPESIAGLEFFKDLFDRANAAPADADDANDCLAFCAGEVGMMPAPGWKPGQIINPDDGCPEMEGNIGVFAMPGATAGTTAPVFLGGSNIGIPTNSENQELAYDLLKILVSSGFQKQFAEAGMIPAIKSELASVAGSEAAEAQAEAAQNSRFVPTSEKWAGVEAANVLQDMLTQIAQGGDIAEAAGQADAAIESTPQRLTAPPTGLQPDGRRHHHDHHHHHHGGGPQAPGRGGPAAAIGAALRPPAAGRRRARGDARLPARPARHVMSMQEYGLPQVFGQPAPWVGLANFRTILEDDYFWTVLWRTLLFCSVNVVLTMVLGVLIALLLEALGKGMRLFVSASLIIAWAMPALTATIVWQWMFDTEYGLVNWALDRQGESWWANQLTFFMVATIIVVWMGIPFVAFTIYAALTQIPVDIRRGRQARRRRLPRRRSATCRSPPSNRSC